MVRAIDSFHFVDYEGAALGTSGLTVELIRVVVQFHGFYSVKNSLRGAVLSLTFRTYPTYINVFLPVNKALFTISPI